MAYYYQNVCSIHKTTVFSITIAVRYRYYTCIVMYLKLLYLYAIDLRLLSVSSIHLDQTSHDTFGILILGTHCVLKIRPRYTLGPSIKIICLAIIQTSHDTCQPVPYRTVPYRYMYRTVRYGTVPFK
jgi:hypothetical protein